MTSSFACVARHSPTTRSVSGDRPSRACSRSPRKIRRVALVRASASSRRVNAFVVVPRGTKIPPARKVAALPKCASATSSVDMRGQYKAWSAMSDTCSPAISMLTSRRSIADSVMVSPGRLLQRDLHALNTIGHGLRRDALARAIDQQWKRERHALWLGDDNLRLRQPLERASQTGGFQLALEHLAMGLRQ